MKEKPERVRVFAIGDVVGKPGRVALFTRLREIIRREGVDFVLANGENSAGGLGITPKILTQLYTYGVDVVTTGNHVWRNQEILKSLEEDPKILRPLNFPPGTPGNGSTVIEKNGVRYGVINLQGRMYMDPIDCPFREGLKEVSRLVRDVDVLIVDIHGEATSEKVAMGWHMNGKVGMVVGTHTHVQTADDQILPNGTAYITDLGMTGPCDSVIGMDRKKALQKFLTMIPSRFEVARENIRIMGLLVELSTETGRALSLKRIQEVL